MKAKPQFIWDVGTAYDLFISLEVLHDPGRFGLRGNWAAGVRSRLPAPHREFLQNVYKNHHLWMLPWIASLSGPKDSAAVLEHLAAIPPAERLPIISLCCIEGEYKDLLFAVKERGSWDEADKDRLAELTLEMYRKEGKKKKKIPDEEIEGTLAMWANSAQFGEDLLAALTSYYEVFYQEEEPRILAALQASAERAKVLVAERPLAEALNELSQGIRYDVDKVDQIQELVMIPSFWTTPLAYLGPIGSDPERWAFLFGGRPVEMSLVPGEMVPDVLSQTLKALADPTRLRILRYLSEEPLTPAELARRLRLRPPTVIHHLDALRLARLVHVTLSHQGRRYEARQEAIDATCDLLEKFLGRQPLDE